MSTNLDLFLALCRGFGGCPADISGGSFAAGLFVVTLTIAANGIIDGYLSRVVGAPPDQCEPWSLYLVWFWAR